MYCTKCGAKNDDGAKFCYQCGNQLGNTAGIGQSINQNQPVNPQPVNQNQPVNSQPVNQNQPVNTQPVNQYQPVNTQPVNQNQPVNSQPVDQYQPVNTQPVDQNQPVDPQTINQNQRTEFQNPNTGDRIQPAAVVHNQPQSVPINQNQYQNQQNIPYPVDGQKIKARKKPFIPFIISLFALAAVIAASAHKFSNDIRLLQHLKEIEEPFEKNQIGSSAMAYKRNPMRSERIASLSNYVMVDALNPAITSSTQWFERTLDDSANKRISVPEAFLAVDGILDLYLNVVDGLVVYPKVIEKHLMQELPFMATENIMMDAVKAGGDRQELHEKIRRLSMEAGKNVKEKGLENNLLELIAADPSFNMSLEELKASMDPARFTGRAKEQTEEFISEVIQPILNSNKEMLGMKAVINV